MPTEPTLLCLAGSLRAASTSRAVVRTVMERLEGRARPESFDIGSLPHYNADLDPPGDAVADFRAALERADGVFIVSPEYNYGVPGLLKNAIDWGSRPAYASPFKDKPCLVATVSGGGLGGVRAQGNLKYVLNGMLARVFPWGEIVIPQAPKKIEDGRLVHEGTLNFLMEAVDAFTASVAPRS